MSAIVTLSPGDILPDRPFTHPQYCTIDLSVLEAMRARLRVTLEDLEHRPSDRHELHIHAAPESNGRLHRMVILDHSLLERREELAVVGFFGQRRSDASPAILQDIDTDLIQEFLEHRYILSYSSRELDDGNWANLVVLEHMDGIQHWRLSQRHAYAARDLAPQYYAGIRLLNGYLPRGMHSERLLLTATKYYDFSGAGFWQAIRPGDAA